MFGMAEGNANFLLANWIVLKEEEEDDESQTIWNGNDIKLMEYRKKKVPFGSGCRAAERIANVILGNSISEIVEAITYSIPLG